MIDEHERARKYDNQNKQIMGEIAKEKTRQMQVEDQQKVVDNKNN
jgi:hypothetical protein